MAATSSHCVYRGEGVQARDHQEDQGEREVCREVRLGFPHCHSGVGEQLEGGLRAWPVYPAESAENWYVARGFFYFCFFIFVFFFHLLAVHFLNVRSTVV